VPMEHVCWEELRNLLAPKKLAVKKIELVDRTKDAPQNPEKGARWRSENGYLFEFTGNYWIFVEEQDKLPKLLTEL